MSTEACFIDFGGTQGSVNHGSVRISNGTLDEREFLSFRHKIRSGLRLPEHVTADVARERRCQLAMAVALADRFAQCQPRTIAEKFAWSPEVCSLIHGPCYELYSDDSSHITIAVAAALASFLLGRLLERPAVPILVGIGTDRADWIVPRIGAFLFDTELAPIIFTGANQPLWRAGREPSVRELQPSSDAVYHFTQLARVASCSIRSGAYWLWFNNLYEASNFRKIDPSGEWQSRYEPTFESTRFNPEDVRRIIREEARVVHRGVPPQDHIAWQLVGVSGVERLFDAASSILVLPLDSCDDIVDSASRILDPRYDAIVIGGHGTGNVDLDSRSAAIQKARSERIVVSTSHCLRAHVDDPNAPIYPASLLSANQEPHPGQKVGGELAGGPSRILSGHWLSPGVAAALVTRALLEGRDQKQTQDLIDGYCDAMDPGAGR